MQDDAIQTARVHPAFIQVTGMKCSCGKISNPFTEISGTEPAPFSYEHIKNFTKDLEVKRELGNRVHVKTT